VTAPRRITIRTDDAGDVTFTDPAWCGIEHTDGTIRADISHMGENEHHRVPTSIGEVVITTGVGKYEYGTAAYTRPYLVVEVDVAVYPDTAELLEETAAALEECARLTRSLGPRLARLLEEDGR